MEAKLQGAHMRQPWMELVETRPIAVAAVAVALGGAAAVLGAWFFEYGLGYKPCHLCLEQRYPYYFGIPLAVMVLLGEQVGAKRRVLLAGLFVIALGMLWNAALGSYHAGVEWQLWKGPQECTGTPGSFGPAKDFLRDLERPSFVRGDEAVWRFLCISLACYNVLILLALGAVVAWCFLSGYRQPAVEDDA